MTYVPGNCRCHVIRAVASFACLCGARDEVREPAPKTLDCWSCRRPLAMTRWTPPRAPPPDAGRDATAAETVRIQSRRPIVIKDILGDMLNPRASEIMAKSLPSALQMFTDTFLRDLRSSFLLRVLEPVPSIAPVNEPSPLAVALNQLQLAEAAYRATHDVHGDDAIETGRAWDRLRRAGDKARAALAHEGASS